MHRELSGEHTICTTSIIQSVPIWLAHPILILLYYLPSRFTVMTKYGVCKNKLCTCVRACVRACVCACVRACVRVSGCGCVRESVHASTFLYAHVCMFACLYV